VIEHSAKPFVEQIVERLPDALVSPEERAWLSGLAGTLPFVTFVLLECHLGGAERHVDISVGSDDGTNPLARVVPAPIAAWPCLMLEYDAGRGREPAVFTRFLPAAPADAETLLRFAEQTLGATGSAFGTLLACCAARTTDEVWITHAGAMCGRPDRPLRLNVGARRLDALVAYARDVGFAERDVTRLSAMLEDVRPFVDDVIFAFDVHDRVLPRFGIECYVADTAQFDAMLAFLRASRLATFAQVDALGAWTGHDLAAHAEWPQSRRLVGDFLGTPDTIVRTLNHVKLVATADGVRQAKAYLAARCVRPVSEPA